MLNKVTIIRLVIMDHIQPIEKNDVSTKEIKNIMDLIQRINEHDVLMKEIKNMSNSSYLNLIHPEWLAHLKNNALYQKYLNNQVEFLPENSNYKYIKPQRVKYADDFLKVLVVGRFMYHQDDRYSTFTAFDCEPLEELCKVFLDKKYFPNTAISNRAKFFIESCGGIHACSSCQEFNKKYNLKFDENKEWWCIAKTKIYNGKKVVLSSKYHVENAFGKNPFFAIFQLVVSGRQFFDVNNEPYMKLSGSIKNMILFKESVLEINQPSDLEFVTDSCSFNTGTSNLTDEHGLRTATKSDIKFTNGDDSEQSIMAEHEAANLQFTANFTKAFKGEESDCLPNNAAYGESHIIKRKRESDIEKYDGMDVKKNNSAENVCLPYNIAYEEYKSQNGEQEPGDDDDEYEISHVKKVKFE